jgi:hypothetical protein
VNRANISHPPPEQTKSPFFKKRVITAKRRLNDYIFALVHYGQ